MEVLVFSFRLFENVDRDAEEVGGKKIDYWGLYSK